jgi:hypothetical protein
VNKNLPNYCFSVLNTTNEVILIKRGENGYYPFYDGIYKGDKEADKKNKEIGVSKAQRQAMEAGSMFGWYIPAANPDIYDKNGKMKK